MSQHNGMDSITTVMASQACTINKYRNLKHSILQCYANTHFNIQCLNMFDGTLHTNKVLCISLSSNELVRKFSTIKLFIYYFYIVLFIRSQEGKVSIMNRLIQTIQSSNLSKGKRCVSSPEHTDQLCDPTTEVQRLGRKVDHSSPSSGKVKNECS